MKTDKKRAFVSSVIVVMTVLFGILFYRYNSLYREAIVAGGGWTDKHILAYPYFLTAALILALMAGKGGKRNEI